jgi:hypothetical protein
MVKQNLKINGNKKLSKILWGEKKEVKRMLLLFFSKVIKHITFQGPPNLELSIGHVVTLGLGSRLRQGLVKV